MIYVVYTFSFHGKLITVSMYLNSIPTENNERRSATSIALKLPQHPLYTCSNMQPVALTAAENHHQHH